MIDRISEPKRLLIVATLEITLQAFLLPYAAHFIDLGWHVDGMANGAESCSPCKSTFDRVWDVSWRRSMFGRGNLRAVREVRDVVMNGNYDIVHVHTPIAGFVVRVAVRLMPKDIRPHVVYTAHGFHFHPGGWFVTNALFAAIEKAAGYWTDRLVVINSDDWNAALKYRLVPAERLRFIPGIGLDVNQWRRDHVPEEDLESIRTELGLRNKDFLFLIVAEMNRGKRHRDALGALARLERDDVWLAFAGGGPLEDEIRRTAVDLGVGARTHFLGFRADIPALMCASTALLLPSEREGLPRSIIESMSLGVPVIATEIRGIRDLLGDDAGLLVDVGDVLGLATAMEKVIGDERVRDRLIANAHSRLGQFALAKTMRLHEVLYGELLGVSK